MIASNKDQDEHDVQPPEYHEHLMRAMLHHTGHGEHPGQYSPLKELTEEFGGAPSPEEIAKKQPSPPQETVGPQPPISGGGGKPSKPPSGTTPAALGQAAAAPAPPAAEGEF